MLTTNQRLDKLAAARVDFAARGMLVGTCLSEALVALLRDFAGSDSESSDDEDLDNDEDGDEPAQQDHAQPEGRGNQGHEVRRRREEHARNIDIIDEAVEGPRVDAFVELARRPCESLSD